MLQNGGGGRFFRVGFSARVVDFFVDGSQQTCFLAHKHVPIPYSPSSNRFCCVCVSRLVFEVCSLASSGGPNNPQNCRPLLVVWLKVVLTPRAHTSTSLLSLVFIFRVVSLIFLWERCLPGSASIFTLIVRRCHASTPLYLQK